MGIKKYRPTTPTRRFQTALIREEITGERPLKSLTKPLKKSGGRNNRGQIAVWFRGGGHKRNLRVIDFRREKFGIPATVASIEYDPNRSARIALLHYRDGEKRYILHPVGLTVGRTIISGPDADSLTGNALPLRCIPPGTTVHNIELRPGKGGQMARSAGASAQLLSKEGQYALLKVPSGEVRKVLVDCMATIGQVGNLDHESISLGKAGRSRWLGRRPHNRGVSMNPVDPPARRRRGKKFRGTAPGHPLGPTHPRVQNTPQQAHGPLYRGAEEIGGFDGTLVEKRTVCG